MRPKHTPLRTCVACRTTGDKRGLLRVVRQPDGAVAFDASGKANGRGAYVCASAKCIALARKQKKLDRSLKATVAPEVFENLLAHALPEPASPESPVANPPM
jgi:predicted RNA-binding protein YlxR (DUF448 family)